MKMWQCPKCNRKFKNTNQSHYCGQVKTVDEYISVQDEAIQPLLNQVRNCIRAAAPHATEKIRWQMPTFWQGENLIHFAAFKKHFSIYPGEEAVSTFAEHLTDYKAAKGAIQFPYNQPIDFDLITAITHWRLNCATEKEQQ
jgi:uncharacterized protein YdhG (YjbR/CyaY superfamily)